MELSCFLILTRDSEPDVPDDVRDLHVQPEAGPHDGEDAGPDHDLYLGHGGSSGGGGVVVFVCYGRVFFQ